MDGAHPPGIATFFCHTPVVAGGTVELGESEAHHVRVRRLQRGAPVRLVDGAGTVALGTLATSTKTIATVDVDRTMQIPPLPPVHLLAPVADRDRMLWLAEKATELGLTSWRAVMWRRSHGVTPRGEGASFQAKVRARMVAALTQSGGAWLPSVLPDVASDGAGETAEAGSRLLLDAAGVPMLSLSLTGPITIAVGPEGGLEPDERERLTAGGWMLASVGSTTLRFETAGTAALAIARAALAANVETTRG